MNEKVFCAGCGGAIPEHNPRRTGKDERDWHVRCYATALRIRDGQARVPRD